MPIRKIGFTIGLVTGIAATLVVFDLWGKYLDRTISEAAQPRVLRPMRPTHEAGFPDSSRNLPAPWLPGFSGQQHDSWRVRSLEGREVSLGDFKGRVVFLNYWSTSCQEDESVVREFLKKHPLRIPVYLSGENPPSDLLAPGVPTTFLLDTRGTAMLRHSGAVNWDDDSVRSYIRRLLK